MNYRIKNLQKNKIFTSKKINKNNEIRSLRNKKIEEKIPNTEPRKKINKQRSQRQNRSNKISKIKKEFDNEMIFNNIKNENKKNYSNANKNDKDLKYKKEMLLFKKENIKLTENVNFLQEGNSLLIKDKEKVVEYYMKGENLGLLDPN
ncbi:hypothetical protein M0812_10709 [Anaeramoeba flamelloides]|uniref:Uncharacterized protein n=1 Tax=Anaeramoeba flamelloides TaxID=1746091 RepID=A0AAV7ZS69_9EUKA|nr:hypothetical protein M0812_10709 [Anaeramoeba flamelloides]